MQTVPPMRAAGERPHSILLSEGRRRSERRRRRSIVLQNIVSRAPVAVSG